MKIAHHYIILFIFSIFTLSLLSCDSDDSLSQQDVLYVRHKGADMPAYIHGNISDKVFIVILHGGPGGTGLEYRPGAFRNQLEKKYAVVYFDQRNSGMSQGKYSQNDLSIDLMAEDVVALTKVLKHKYGSNSKLFLLGHSWGGALGTAVLLKNDNQKIFNGWIEVDGGHDLKGIYFESIRNFKQVSKEQISLGNSVAYWEKILNKVNTIDSLKYNDDDSGYLNSTGFEVEEQLINDLVINESSGDAAVQSLSTSIFKNNPITVFWNSINVNSTLADRDKIWEKLSFNDRLKEIKIPALLLWGKYDMVVPVSMGQDAYERLGSTEKKIVVFDKAGHSPMDGQPDEFANEVIDFIEKNK